MENQVEKIMNDVKVPRVLWDLVPKYLNNRKTELEKLNIALATSDFDFIKNVGHKLKGNAASYGFFELTELGKKIEVAAHESDIVSLEKLLLIYKDYLENLNVEPAT